MLAVQHITSKEIHTWHRLRPSSHRRPADSSLTRLRGITSAATSTSDTAVEATKLCGTRWKARTRRMVTRTSRFHRNVAAISSTNSVTTSTEKTEKGGSRPGGAAPPGVDPTTPLGFGLLLKASGPRRRATPVEATERLAASIALGIPAPPRGRKRALGSGWTRRVRAWKGALRDGEGREESSSPYSGPSLGRSSHPSGASPLSPPGSLFQWRKKWAPSGVQLLHLSPCASPSCLASLFPGERAVIGLGIRGHGECPRAEWVWRVASDSEPGGPWAELHPGWAWAAWSGEPADWSRAFRLSRGSPSPLCTESTLTRDSPKKVHNHLGIPQPDPWDSPEVQFDIWKQRDPPSTGQRGSAFLDLHPKYLWTRRLGC